MNRDFFEKQMRRIEDELGGERKFLQDEIDLTWEDMKHLKVNEFLDVVDVLLRDRLPIPNDFTEVMKSIERFKEQEASISLRLS